MKNFKPILGTVLMTIILFSSCTENDNDYTQRATAEDFNNLKNVALENLTQNFQFNADDGNTTLTSENGVQININGNCLTLNGNAVTGEVNLEFVEIFEKGNMLTTNKPTMGVLPNGDKALLITGGEFFMEATKNGAILQTTCDIQLIIPANLTGGIDNDMILWDGIIDDEGNLAWEEENIDANQGEAGVFGEGNNYYGFFNSFGWSNVDRFYSDPRPKTTILVGVPEGYDNANSSVYISYDGEDSGLAKLDTYDAVSGLFSEHYGQIPIGLECHIIFATEENDNWKYAIKTVTIVANDIITFAEGETNVATEAQLTTIINGLP